MATRKVRLVSFGDQFLAGLGDPRALGWLGRVLARTWADTSSIQSGSEQAVQGSPALFVESYPVAAPNEGTDALSRRWLADANARLSAEHENRIVVALSDHDLDLDQGSARSRLQLANILDGTAQLGLPTLVIGPPPSADQQRNVGIAELNRAFRDVSSRRRNSYVDLFSALNDQRRFLQDLQEHGGLPGQSGYGMIAWVVLNQGWYEWLGMQPPSVRN